jgi:hypothetical protein
MNAVLYICLAFVVTVSPEFNYILSFYKMGTCIMGVF